ncbi:MAG: glycosyltransferase family 4 protein [Candidatus Binatia bacterium]
MRVLVTGPALADPGGVSGYHGAVLPHLRASVGAVEYLEIGSSRGRGGCLHPLADQAQFRAAVRRLRPQIVQVNPSLNAKSFLRDGLLARQAAQRRIPVLVFFHGWDPRFEARLERSRRRFFAATYRRATAFVVLADAFRQRLRAWGVTAPIHLATTAVASELVQGFAFDRKPLYDGASRPLRMLFLARLERGKNVRVVLEALASLRRRGAPVTLTVAGDGEDLPALRRFAAGHPELAEAITIAGDVRGARKHELFASHDVYCLPSASEGMPASVLEAMAFGLPVIAAPAGGLADVLEDGRTGCVLSQLTAAAIADAVSRLQADPPRLRAIAAHNHRYALAHFLAPAVAERLAAIYRALAR